MLFGGVEQDNASGLRRGGYDIVVTVAGPRQSTVTFRKERMLAIWVNSDSRVMRGRAVLSRGAVKPAALSDCEHQTLRRLQPGLDNTPLPQGASVNIAEAGSDHPFRQAFIKIKTEHGLYREVSNGVTLLAPSCSAPTIPLPAEVLVGTYEVDVRLLLRLHPARAHARPVRGLQVRLRAGGDRGRARSRRALRPCYRGHGARDRVVASIVFRRIEPRTSS